MTRLFGRMDARACTVRYAVKRTDNESVVLVGTAEELVDCLRVRPKLQGPGEPARGAGIPPHPPHVIVSRILTV